MSRLHLIEIHEQNWCPRVIRDAATGYLQFVVHVANPYLPVVDRLRNALKRTGAERIVDLCSGAGGPWLKLLPLLRRDDGSLLPVLLTDRHPNFEAVERMPARSGGLIEYEKRPIDASRMPSEFDGFRTLFSSFHHFRPEHARRLLGDTVRRRQGIGVFEMTHRSFLAIVLMGLAPFFVLLFTPFIRPFRWSRLLCTYLIPILPLVALFDGLVSCLRTYSTAELKGLTEAFAGDGYVWEIGEDSSGPGPVPVTYLIGYPGEPSP